MASNFSNLPQGPLISGWHFDEIQNGDVEFFGVRTNYLQEWYRIKTVLKINFEVRVDEATKMAKQIIDGIGVNLVSTIMVNPMVAGALYQSGGLTHAHLMSAYEDEDLILLSQPGFLGTDIRVVIMRETDIEMIYGNHNGMFLAFNENGFRLPMPN